MKKRSKILIALIVIVSMFTITAQAKDFCFQLTAKGVAKKVGENQRDRTQASWLLSNYNSSSSTFVVGTHVLDFIVRDLSRQPMSSVLVVENFINNYAYTYTTVPSDNQPLLLFAQLDSRSTSSSVYCDGAWYT